MHQLRIDVADNQTHRFGEKPDGVVESTHYALVGRNALQRPMKVTGNAERHVRASSAAPLGIAVGHHEKRHAVQILLFLRSQFAKDALAVMRTAFNPTTADRHPVAVNHVVCAHEIVLSGYERTLHDQLARPTDFGFQAFRHLNPFVRHLEVTERVDEQVNPVIHLLRTHHRQVITTHLVPDVAHLGFVVVVLADNDFGP